MAAWAIIAVPLLIMFFALGMERVETRLRQVAVAENDVEEFLEQARPNEVRALFRHGIGRALELFRLRRRRTPAGRSPQASPVGYGGHTSLDQFPGFPDFDFDDSDLPTRPLNLKFGETVPIRQSQAS